MHEFLTLAISEKDPKKLQDDFGIVVMDMKTKNILNLAVEKDEIISQSGEIFWDIGFITKVKDVSQKLDGKLVPSGFVSIQDARNMLKTILDSKSTNPAHFFDNKNVVYAVVRVSNVRNITVTKSDDGKMQSRLDVSINGLSPSKKLDPLLNKDFRWIKYWSRIYQMGTVDEKKQQYIKLLNQKSKTLYFVMYRHTFRKGGKCSWIVGTHWL